MNRTLCLSGIILSLTSPISTLAYSNHLYTTPESPYHKIHSHNQDYAAQHYFSLSLERLKNIEEILMHLSATLENNDLDASRMNYIKAHYQYASIRPLVVSFDGFDQTLNSIATDLPFQTEDNNFVGFHAIEYALFAQNDIAKAFVENQKLLSKVRTLVQLMSQQNTSILDMLGYLKGFSQQITVYKLTGSENLYSGADLGEIVASIEGINLIIDQIHDFIPHALLHEIDTARATICKVLHNYRDPNSDFYLPYSSLSPNDHLILSQTMNKLDSLLTQVINNVTPQISNNSTGRNSIINLH